VLAAVAARAEGWFLSPVVVHAERVEREAPPSALVAVVGLGRGCGASTIARALGVELARRHRSGAAVVSAAAVPPGATLATAAARRLARALGPDARPVGRLALTCDDTRVREAAGSRASPVVLDVSHGVAPEGALALADRAFLVASPDVEPSLAGVAASTLARGDARPLIVLNRCIDAGHWGELPDFSVAEARVAARLALAGRDPLGSLASAVAGLADACEEVAARA
jgi:hypothetical protein